MEKKGTIISLLFISAIVISAVVYIIFTGITAKEYNYVQLEINPRVEFICDKDFKVVSYKPLNDDAKVLLAGENYKGVDIEDVSTAFVDLCARAGYINVEGENNAINITVIDGITQALDVHVTQSIYEYLRDKEILCTVVENYEDRSMFEEKKKNDVCCANKYKLIKTINEYLPQYSIKQLDTLSEVELIDLVTNIHSTDKYVPTENEIILKSKLIDFNREKYNNHINSISKESQKEFSKKFDKHQKKNINEYSNDFNKEYTNWQNNHIS